MYLVQKEINDNEYWYLEETKRTDKGPRKAFSIYLGKPERIYELVEKPLRRLKLSTHTFGTTATLLHGVEEIGLEEILSEEMPVGGRLDMTPVQRLIMVLGARYERPASKLDVATEWYKESILPLLWRCGAPHVNTVYDTMDQLTRSVRRRVKERLRNRLLEKGLEVKRLIWDTTNFYNYGGTDDLRRRGRSKDGKHSCPLVGMGVLTSEENIPLTQVVFPGNKHDKKVFEDALPTLLSLVEEVTDDPKNVTFVFDRGCNDEDLIRTIERTSHYIGKLKRNQDPAELLRTPVNDLNHLYTTDKDHEVRGSMNKGEVLGELRPIAIMWHGGTAAKKKKRLKRYKEKAFEVCKDLEERVGKGGRGRNLTAKGIQREMDSLHEVEKAIDWSFDEKSQSFTWEFIKDEWKRLLDEAGKSLLFTSHEDWRAERVIKAYTGKWRVEHSFRLLKGPIPVRPVYHGEGNRIREHYFLMFLLLVVHRWLMERIREPVLREFGIGEGAVLHFLKELRLVTDKPSNSNKPDFKLEEPNEIQRGIVDTLNLKRFVPGAK